MRQILIFAYLRVYFSEVHKHVKSLRRNLIVKRGGRRRVERYCSGIFSNDIDTFVHLVVNSIDIALLLQALYSILRIPSSVLDKLSIASIVSRGAVLQSLHYITTLLSYKIEKK